MLPERFIFQIKFKDRRAFFAKKEVKLRKKKYIWCILSSAYRVRNVELSPNAERYEIFLIEFNIFFHFLLFIKIMQMISVQWVILGMTLNCIYALSPLLRIHWMYFLQMGKLPPKGVTLCVIISYIRWWVCTSGALVCVELLFPCHYSLVHSNPEW